VGESAKPAFELILSGMESAPADRPFEPDQIKRLIDLHFATRSHYSRIVNGMLGVETGTPGLPLPLLHGAQMLHRRIADAFGQAALRLALQSESIEPRGPRRSDVRSWLLAELRPGDLCLTLGAGDLTTLPDEIIAALQARDA